MTIPYRLKHRRCSCDYSMKNYQYQGVHMSDSDSEIKIRDEYYDSLLEIKKDSEKNYDQSLLVISPSLLGFSMMFIKDIVPLKEAVDIELLYYSWIALVVSIISVIFSFRLSIHNAISHMNLMHKIANKPFKIFYKHANKNNNFIINFFNWTAGISLIGGFILMAFFIFNNIQNQRAELMSNKQVKNNAPPKPQPEYQRRGQIISPPKPSPPKGGQGSQSGKP